MNISIYIILMHSVSLICTKCFVQLLLTVAWLNKEHGVLLRMLNVWIKVV